jgi:hypothetical protein
MEVLGLAASVAGILSLVGQSIEGIIKLQRMLRSPKKTDESVTLLQRDIDSFQGSLNQVQRLLSLIHQEQPFLLRSTLAHFEEQLMLCQHDILSWINQC